MADSNRRPYLTATVLDQAFLDQCADNLECRLEMVCDIERPDTGFIRASDRNKYVGNVFYEALLSFPLIERTVGDWLSPEIQFSQLSLELSNVDGRFNNILPGGDQYKSFIGKSVTVRLGLAEQESTYKTIFTGTVTDIGGFARTVKAIKIVARSSDDKLNTDFPNQALSRDVYPALTEDLIGKILPVIYGDWSVGIAPDPATIPAYVLNGNDSAVNGGTEELPNETRGPIQLRISENDLKSFATNAVYLRRSEVWHLIPGSQVTSVGAGNKTFSVLQGNSFMPVEGEPGTFEPYAYEDGDEFFVRVVGKDLGTKTTNLIAQAKDIIKTYGNVGDSVFHPNWETVMAKASPPENAIALMPARVWTDEPTSALTYALSMLEQVRVEAFIDRSGLLKLLPLHFDSFVPEPEFRVKNWDVIEGTFEPYLDDRNNFNRARAAFDYHPSREENARQTRIFRNQASIDQVGRALESKIIEYPNLVNEADVENQLKETLKLSSALFENISVSLTWRAMLLDIGDFVALDVKIGSTIFSDIPCLIRDLGYDPNGIQIPMKLWSFQLVPFAYYNSGVSGIVGGINAIITNE